MIHRMTLKTFILIIMSISGLMSKSWERTDMGYSNVEVFKTTLNYQFVFLPYSGSQYILENKNYITFNNLLLKGLENNSETLENRCPEGRTSAPEGVQHGFPEASGGPRWS